MSARLLRTLLLLMLSAVLATQTGCNHKPAAPAVPPMSEQHKLALAQAVRGGGFLFRKQPARAVECYKQALKTELGNRGFSQQLAFALYKAGRTEEAIPVWKSLAAGDDDQARTASKWLNIEVA